MPLERGEQEEPLLRRNSSGRSSSKGEDSPAAPAIGAATDAPSTVAAASLQRSALRLDSWNWPVMLLLSGFLILATHSLMHKEMSAFGKLGKKASTPSATQPHTPQQHHQQLQTATATATAAEPAQQAGGEQSMSVLEQQLAGCRASRADPIPSVDLQASLRVLDTYTPKQMQTAQTFTSAVSACSDFACLQQANQLPRAPGQFRFPHFMVVGFPKCATTSVYCHLIQHQQVQYPQQKEPHTLTIKCQKPGLDCPAETQREYLEDVLNLQQAAESQFTKAAFEGSTHYVLEADWMAEQLAATFPWLRLVVSLREPISQAISMHNHNLEHGRTFYHCNSTHIFNCVRRGMNKSMYTPKMAKWLGAFPASKVHLVQFENLTAPESMGGAMTGIKSFLGVDPALPSSQLPLTNSKHQHGPPDELEGWVMARHEYEQLVDMALSDTTQLVDLLSKQSLADPAALRQWARTWERVWEGNLGRCEGAHREATCRVLVS